MNRKEIKDQIDWFRKVLLWEESTPETKEIASGCILICLRQMKEG